MTRTVAIFLYPDVEVLDLAGPFEVFHSASRMRQRMDPQAPPPFRVITVAESTRPVAARGGLLLTPQHAIDSHPAIDLLIIPGGVVDGLIERSPVIEWLRTIHASTAVTASVCTGAFMLARAGLLDGQAATTHWEDLADLAARFPRVHVVGDRRWVDLGRIVTSAGIAAGIDMSLHLVARLEGSELAVRTARQMDYPWSPE